jgi:hypothetical protein
MGARARSRAVTLYDTLGGLRMSGTTRAQCSERLPPARNVASVFAGQNRGAGMQPSADSVLGRDRKIKAVRVSLDPREGFLTEDRG